MRDHRAAPSALPAPRARAVRGGARLCEITALVQVVTPILGGGSQTRALDEAEFIRAAIMRGHLRFWWRALHAQQHASPADLFAAERKLWGGPADDEGGRSAVELRVDIERVGETDEADIRLHDSRNGNATPGAYALWPARSAERTKQPPAPRRQPGTVFRLRLIAPVDQEQEVREVVRAWLLFGGYGSRTRRGLGSLCVVDDARTWLPASASRDAITAVFGRDIFAPTGAAAIETPCFASAALHVGTPPRDAMSAWTTALDWLKEFRQGTKGKEGDRAREPGTGKNQPRRPSISNWPEADKIRHLARRTRAHPPRHNQTPAWPRAGFGLPIIGQFQTRGRNGERLDEPGPFELRWRSGNEEHDRLTSPLIVKAFPLADGTFAPCALWLNRAYPNGDVILKGVANSAAPFDRLVAEGDTPRFSALAGKAGLREVFLDWLHEKHNTTVVAP